MRCCVLGSRSLRERRTHPMVARISAALPALILAGMMPLHGQDQSPSVDATERADVGGSCETESSFGQEY